MSLLIPLFAGQSKDTSREKEDSLLMKSEFSLSDVGAMSPKNRFDRRGCNPALECFKAELDGST